MNENIKNAIDLAFAGKVSDMSQEIETALMQKVSDALAGRRVDVAQSILATNENEEVQEDVEALEEIAKWRKGNPQVNTPYDDEIAGRKSSINKNATYALDKWSGQKIPLTPKNKEDELEGRKSIADKGYKTKKTLKTAIKGSLGKHGKSDLPEDVEETDESYIEEVLSVSDGVDKWIHDFVHSDNPKFEGKSKKERIQMALGAFYSAKKGK